MEQKELILQGIPVSDGIAIGVLHVIQSQEPDFVEFTIAASEVEKEISRFKKALTSSKKDLHSLQMTLEETGGNEAATIIDAHIQMLDDPILKDTVEAKIRGLLQNTESVFQTVVGEYEAQFAAFDDEYFKQRIFDIKDLSKRVLMHLNPLKKEDETFPKGSIIYSNELVPSETATGIGSNVLAFVSHHGGGTSHAALIARACGIPFVSNVEEHELFSGEDVQIIVDGYEGIVILYPSEETLSHYRGLLDREENEEVTITTPVKTLDNIDVAVLANISSCESLDTTLCTAADGVGLFRTEFMALGKDITMLSVEMQEEEYSKIYTAFREKPVVFRVFDFGADKKAPHMQGQMIEQNPALGMRAIRYLFAEETLFRIQLRAMLKASYKKTLRLLFPLVADPADMVAAKEITLSELKKLPKDARPKTILFGAMIELPSAVLLCDAIAEECDFLSIGSNDLMQYTLGVDRSNKHVNTLYGTLHPSLIHSLDLVIQVGKKKNISVSLCGELASEPRYTKLLVGLGLTQFSCTPRAICNIKKQIEACSFQEAKHLAEAAKKVSTTAALEELISSNINV